MDTFQHGFAGGVLRTIDQNKIGRFANFDNTTVKLTHSGGIACGKTKRNFRRNIPKAGQHCDHPQNSQRLYTRPSRRVSSQNNAFGLANFKGRPHRQQAGTLIAIMHNLDAPRTALAQAGDLIVRQGGMPAIDMADNIRIRL